MALSADATPTVRLEADGEAVARAALEHVIEAATAAAQERGTFRIALAGGSTPRRLYQLLASPEASGRIDWSRWQIFFGDERAVPPDHEKSNYRMAREAFLDNVPIAADNVHRIHGELPREQAARAYAETLGTEPLDLVLLGMGDDGHTASLFPGSPALEEKERAVVTSESPVPPRERVSLSLPTIDAARAVLFLVTGAGKADRLAQMLGERKSGAPKLPSARIAPKSGELFLYVDEAAARHMEQTS